MTVFGEKVRKARTELKFTQKELALMTGISLRTIQNYESGERMPKSRESYRRLGEALHLNVDTLIDDKAEFKFETNEKYAQRGRYQAEWLIKEVSALYAGGDLDEEDMDAMMLAIQDAYWIAKKRSRKDLSERFKK